MPIKIPKGFPRRKSSGNVLDEAQPTEPSFKVFARPNSEHKSLDMNINLNRQKPLPARRNSYEDEDEDLFTVMRPDAANRGSGGTSSSLSTVPYDSGASSTRLSSSSTNPSSVDARSDKNIHSTTQNHPTEAPLPPPHQSQSKSSAFLRNAGRTFSFGVKSKPPEVSEPPVPPVPATKGRFSFSQGRERAMTASSISTATPPRLLESDLPLDASGLESFGNMFEGIGAKSREPSPIRRVMQETSNTPNGNQLRPDSMQASRANAPPVTNDRSAHIESSPYSWTSDNSRDGLMQTPSSTNTVVHNSPQATSGRTFGKPLRETTPLQNVKTSTDDNMFADTPSRSQIYSRPPRQTGPPPSAFSSSSRRTTSSRSNSTITGATLQTSPVLERDDSMFDPSFIASAELATKYQETRPTTSASTLSNKKVMTPAQFERYKQQEEERHRMNKVFQNKKPESDESDDNYDDADEDDETERDRQVAKQRRKQEAHLAVYRQTMMKVTGEVPVPGSTPSGSFNPPVASQSATDLSNQFSAITFDKSPARSSDEDEDDDVPLGILAAHGFPNKNKPPNRLATSTSNPNLRSIVQHQQGPASLAGESMKRGSLPVFARHLPEDPYYGASLVNQSNRESMAMNTPQYAPSGAATAHPHHPAGLVGVIAGEERARAMRRGSPNAATGGYDVPAMSNHPGMPRSQTTGSMQNLMVPGMPMMPGMQGMPMMPGMPPMLSPGDHAQIQMSQQMTQMMQMQMQWMQQMQQLMSNQGPSSTGAPQMNQMGPMPPNMQAGATMARPQSVPLQSQLGQDQRTMSLLSPPTLASWNGPPSSFRPGPGSTYTPSIAPSERSNVGLASRYRPVSTLQEPDQTWNKRASTMTSTTFRPWSHVSSGPKQPTPTVRKVATPADDEDDEQGWAEMKAKKEQKKKTWKLRKGQNVLQELYN